MTTLSFLKKHKNHKIHFKNTSFLAICRTFLTVFVLEKRKIQSVRKIVKNIFFSFFKSCKINQNTKCVKCGNILKTSAM